MEFKTELGKPANSRNFLKLADGEEVVGAFRGEIHEFYQIWTPGQPRRIVDKHEAGGSFRFRINFVTRENGLLVSKIFEGPYRVYQILRDLNSEYDLQKIYVKIKREGTSKNTRYSILPKEQINPKADTLIAAVSLQELYTTPEGKLADLVGDDPGPSLDDIPF